ncbi:acidic ribosomal protein P1 [Reticulomyxa filosa]|uniref:Acidic ribosomal protein P1 n=1 Tax=Reticulomyxa filosa TaxID=46433 RepID=X6MM70_RETFI|nr:acidic ribosomal protein P1 [Reticulomyxa filosa]|eukprot:ETO14185.1 acidic ribosomal protein P1 [Reticulomyxa filosa]
MANKNTIAQLACTYASLILHDDGVDISVENVNKLLDASGVKIEKFWPKLFTDLVKTTPVPKLLAMVSKKKPQLRKHKKNFLHQQTLACQGGGGVAVSTGGAAPAAGGAGAGKAEEAEKEKEKEDEEKESSASGPGLFGDDKSDDSD